MLGKAHIKTCPSSCAVHVKRLPAIIAAQLHMFLFYCIISPSYSSIFQLLFPAAKALPTSRLGQVPLMVFPRGACYALPTLQNALWQQRVFFGASTCVQHRSAKWRKWFAFIIVLSTAEFGGIDRHACADISDRYTCSVCHSHFYACALSFLSPLIINLKLRKLAISFFSGSILFPSVICYFDYIINYFPYQVPALQMTSCPGERPLMFHHW